MAVVNPDVLKKAVETLVKLGNAPDAEAALTQLKAVRAALADLEQAIPGARTGLDAFFNEVSEGMLEAQRRLDRESETYNAGLANRPGLPTLFRIPKATAEFQFGMESSSKKGFNVLLLSGKQSTTEEVRHKVSFDVVAVPPPADMLGKVELGRPLLKDWLKERLDAVQDDTGTTAQNERAIAQLLHDHMDETLLLRGDGLFLLALRRQDPDDGRFYLNIGLAGAPDRLEVMRIPHPATGWRQEVQRLVATLGDALATRDNPGA